MSKTTEEREADKARANLATSLGIQALRGGLTSVTQRPIVELGDQEIVGQCLPVEFTTLYTDPLFPQYAFDITMTVVARPTSVELRKGPALITFDPGMDRDDQ